VTRDEVAGQVHATIADFFGIDPAGIGDDTVVDDIPGWDSTSHVGVILAVEDALGIEFAVERVTAFRDVGELVDESWRLASR
jgi:acyl carrier protein